MWQWAWSSADAPPASSPRTKQLDFAARLHGESQLLTRTHAQAQLDFAARLHARGQAEAAPTAAPDHRPPPPAAPVARRSATKAELEVALEQECNYKFESRLELEIELRTQQEALSREMAAVAALRADAATNAADGAAQKEVADDEASTLRLQTRALRDELRRVTQQLALLEASNAAAVAPEQALLQQERLVGARTKLAALATQLRATRGELAGARSSGNARAAVLETQLRRLVSERQRGSAAVALEAARLEVALLDASEQRALRRESAAQLAATAERAAEREASHVVLETSAAAALATQCDATAAEKQRGGALETELGEALSELRSARATAERSAALADTVEAAAATARAAHLNAIAAAKQRQRAVEQEVSAALSELRGEEAAAAERGAAASAELAAATSNELALHASIESLTVELTEVASAASSAMGSAREASAVLHEESFAMREAHEIALRDAADELKALHSQERRRQQSAAEQGQQALEAQAASLSEAHHATISRMVEQVARKRKAAQAQAALKYAVLTDELRLADDRNAGELAAVRAAHTNELDAAVSSQSVAVGAAHRDAISDARDRSTALEDELAVAIRELRTERAAAAQKVATVTTTAAALEWALEKNETAFHAAKVCFASELTGAEALTAQNSTSSAALESLLVTARREAKAAASELEQAMSSAAEARTQAAVNKRGEIAAEAHLECLSASKDAVLHNLSCVAEQMEKDADEARAQLVPALVGNSTSGMQDVALQRTIHRMRADLGLARAEMFDARRAAIASADSARAAALNHAEKLSDSRRRSVTALEHLATQHEDAVAKKEGEHAADLAASRAQSTQSLIELNEEHDATMRAQRTALESSATSELARMRTQRGTVQLKESELKETVRRMSLDLNATRAELVEVQRAANGQVLRVRSASLSAEKAAAETTEAALSALEARHGDTLGQTQREYATEIARSQRQRDEELAEASRSLQRAVDELASERDATRTRAVHLRSEEGTAGALASALQAEEVQLRRLSADLDAARDELVQVRRAANAAAESGRARMRGESDELVRVKRAAKAESEATRVQLNEVKRAAEGEVQRIRSASAHAERVASETADAALAALKDRNNEIMDRVRSEHGTEVAEMERVHADKLGELTETLTASITKLATKHTDAMTETQRIQLEQQRMVGEQTLELRSENNRAEVEQMRAFFASRAEVEQMRAQHRSNVDALEHGVQTKLALGERRCEEKVEAIRASSLAIESKALEELRKLHADQVDQLRASAAEELGRQAHEHSEMSKAALSTALAVEALALGQLKSEHTIAVAIHAQSQNESRRSTAIFKSQVADLERIAAQQDVALAAAQQSVSDHDVAAKAEAALFGERLIELENVVQVQKEDLSRQREAHAESLAALTTSYIENREASWRQHSASIAEAHESHVAAVEATSVVVTGAQVSHATALDAARTAHARESNQLQVEAGKQIALLNERLQAIKAVQSEEKIEYASQLEAHSNALLAASSSRQSALAQAREAHTNQLREANAVHSDVRATLDAAENANRTLVAELAFASSIHGEKVQALEAAIASVSAAAEADVENVRSAARAAAEDARTSHSSELADAHAEAADRLAALHTRFRAAEASLREAKCSYAVEFQTCAAQGEESALQMRALEEMHEDSQLSQVALIATTRDEHDAALSAASARVTSLEEVQEDLEVKVHGLRSSIVEMAGAQLVAIQELAEEMEGSHADAMGAARAQFACELDSAEAQLFDLEKAEGAALVVRSLEMKSAVESVELCNTNIVDVHTELAARFVESEASVAALHAELESTIGAYASAIDAHAAEAQERAAAIDALATSQKIAMMEAHVAHTNALHAAHEQVAELTNSQHAARVDLEQASKLLHFESDAALRSLQQELTNEHSTAVRTLEMNYAEAKLLQAAEFSQRMANTHGVHNIATIDLIAEHKSEFREAQHELDMVLATQRLEHSNAMDELHCEHRSALESMSAERNQEQERWLVAAASVTREHEDAHAQLARRYEAAHLSTGKEHEQVLASEIASLRRTYVCELSEGAFEGAAALEAAVSELRIAHADADAEAEDRHRSDARSRDHKHTLAQAKLRSQEHTARTAALKELRASHQVMVDGMVRRSAEEISARSVSAEMESRSAALLIEQQHAGLVSSIRSEYIELQAQSGNALQLLERKHAFFVTSLEATHVQSESSRDHMLEMEHAAAKTELRAETSIALSGLEAQHAAQVHAQTSAHAVQREEHATAAGMLRENCARALERATSEAALRVATLEAHHEASLEKFKSHELGSVEAAHKSHSAAVELMRATLDTEKEARSALLTLQQLFTRWLKKAHLSAEKRRMRSKRLERLVSSRLYRRTPQAAFDHWRSLTVEWKIAQYHGGLRSDMMASHDADLVQLRHVWETERSQRLTADADAVSTMRAQNEKLVASIEAQSAEERAAMKRLYEDAREHERMQLAAESTAAHESHERSLSEQGRAHAVFAEQLQLREAEATRDLARHKLLLDESETQIKSLREELCERTTTLDSMVATHSAKVESFTSKISGMAAVHDAKVDVLRAAVDNLNASCEKRVAKLASWEMTAQNARARVLRTTTKRALNIWMSKTRTRARVRAFLVRATRQRHFRDTLKCWQRWQLRVARDNVVRRAAMTAQRHASRSSLAGGWTQWCARVALFKIEARGTSRAQRSLARRSFQAWVAAVTEAHRNVQLLSNALIRRRAVTSRAAFFSWKQWTTFRSHCRAVLGRASGQARARFLAGGWRALLQLGAAHAARRRLFMLARSRQRTRLQGALEVWSSSVATARIVISRRQRVVAHLVGRRRKALCTDAWQVLARLDLHSNARRRAAALLALVRARSLHNRSTAWARWNDTSCQRVGAVVVRIAQRCRERGPLRCAWRRLVLWGWTCAMEAERVAVAQRNARYEERERATAADNETALAFVLERLRVAEEKQAEDAAKLHRAFVETMHEQDIVAEGEIERLRAREARAASELTGSEEQCTSLSAQLRRATHELSMSKSEQEEVERTAAAAQTMLAMAKDAAVATAELHHHALSAAEAAAASDAESRVASEAAHALDVAASELRRYRAAAADDVARLEQQHHRALSRLTHERERRDADATRAVEMATAMAAALAQALETVGAQNVEAVRTIEEEWDANERLRLELGASVGESEEWNANDQFRAELGLY